MRDNVEAECPEDYFRKSITVPFLYCTRFTDLHARTALGLQLVPSIIENIAPVESLDPPLIILLMTSHFQLSTSHLSVEIFELHQRIEFTFHISYAILDRVCSTVIL